MPINTFPSMYFYVLQTSFQSKKVCYREARKMKMTPGIKYRRHFIYRKVIIRLFLVLIELGTRVTGKKVFLGPISVQFDLEKKTKSRLMIDDN
jgi:hypothetical protein